MHGNLPDRRQEERSGWYGNLHMWAPAYVKLPKWATHERLGLKCDEVVIADCCLCKMRADETQCHITTGPTIHGLLHDDMTEDERSDALWGNYFESYSTIECAEGFGCTVKRRRRSSRHLRESWYEHC